jgi:hypothetical protein
MYLIVGYFFNTIIFRHLWQLKAAVFLHRYLIRSVLLALIGVDILYSSILGAQKLTGDNLKVVWAEFSILSLAILLGV